MKVSDKIVMIGKYHNFFRNILLCEAPNKISFVDMQTSIYMYKVFRIKYCSFFLNDISGEK